ncbi:MULTISPECIES: NUDIX hydrolase [unclassified Sphingobium]|uniref:NUDIX hydrolase n=1 Tax=unclassified Sphingobium TaxID=2611147 RepID=UPI000D176EDA|nr:MULTISPECIES: NUDIX domain-containing protein [unclassified Sphingobium]MBG6120434.1 8-oxo-dGTP pyrophosphatase MutT (NUDIX family) [Sphingobium sp. JAI105]PSO10053.1 NUDIX hydrolase [Sphingobium sp. AEW4]
MADETDTSRSAATLIVVQDRPAMPPEILMVERSSKMAFAAGALVFPGGALDASDHDLAARLGGPLPIDEAAARIAAIRETIEEAGIGLGLTGPADAAAMRRIRDGLHNGEGLGDLLDRMELGLDLAALIPFARWHPAPSDRAMRVFDARFYLARAPEGQVASVDTTENVRLLWSSAADTLALCEAGRASLIYPTRRNLERLALCPSWQALAEHAAAYPVEKIRPWQEERDGEKHLCIPTHLGYPVTSQPMVDVQRG